jgi:glycosyltransferase involved in cell wall biosynthesis
MSEGPRKCLLIAFHYPPCATSSGLQRSLAFSVHLRQHGWNPVVLTAHPTAYERASGHQLGDIPADVPVARTLCLDSSRHLSFRGRHVARLAIPDRWRTWWLTAVPIGLHLIRRQRINAIWSTYPIATAHSIGSTLARLTALPWVADFRDPMVEFVPETQEFYPRDPVLRNARLGVEAAVMRRCSHAVFCTDWARRIAVERYPQTPPDRLHVIPNGYNEQAFRDAERISVTKTGQRLLLHSGNVYPGADRDPTSLFRALKALRDSGDVTARDFELRLRDPSHVDHFTKLAADCGVADLVSVCPPLPYREALAEMLVADGLLLLQGFTSNPAVPAKLYEYLRARRPIVALVHHAGETAATLRNLGIETTAELTDVASIKSLLARWLRAVKHSTDDLPPFEAVTRYSRERQAGELARVLDEAVTDAESNPPRYSTSSTKYRGRRFVSK